MKPGIFGLLMLSLFNLAAVPVRGQSPGPCRGIVEDGGRALRIFFRPEMVASSGNSISLSSQKPGDFVRAVLARYPEAQIHTFDPVTRDDLSAVHSPDYVEGILSGRIVNGFGNNSLEVAASLPYTSGSLLAAARAAIRDQTITISPTSGFHHARYRDSCGFCTFNGLVVAASKLIKDDGLSRVAIIDADYHFGDGTEELLIPSKHIDDKVFHFTFGLHFGTPDKAQAYLDTIDQLRKEFETWRPEVIIYQAGADVHVNDPLGGVLTTEQMRERDRRVLNIARDLKIPLVWNLAGGYQLDRSGSIAPVVALHMQTVEETIEALRP